MEAGAVDVTPAGAAHVANGAAAGFVLVDVASVRMAVAVQDVVQGIAWPERLDLLPRRANAGAVRGVFEYQGQPVPLLDLALWLDVGADLAAGATRSYPRALIVRGQGQLVAIAVDAVRGLQKLAPDSVTRISHDDGGDEIFHSVARCAGIDGVANVLDVARLMTLAKTWSGDADGGASARAVAAAATPLRSYAVVAAGGCSIGFPVAALIEVLPAPQLDPFQSPQTEGLCLWRGRHVPVTSVAKCFPALAAPRGQAAPLLALFESGGLALGVLLDEVPRIRRFRAADHDHGAAEPLRAIADDDGALLQLVDMAALYARFPERALSRADGAPAQRGAAAADTNASSHIVFDAGGAASTPIDGIEAVLPLPALAADASHMAWRGAALKLHDLRAQNSAAGTVIVVQGERAPLGFIVDAVQALVQARAGRVSRLAMAGRGVVDLLTTGSGSSQATYSTRDLAKLAREHC